MVLGPLASRGGLIGRPWQRGTADPVHLTSYGGAVIESGLAVYGNPLSAGGGTSILGA